MITSDDDADFESLLDVVALVRARLEGDRPAAEALLDGADLFKVVTVLADLAATLFKVVDGDRERAIARLTDWQRQMIEAASSE